MTNSHFEDNAIKVTLTSFPYADCYMVYGEIFYKCLNERYVFDKLFDTVYDVRVFMEGYMKGVRK